MKMTTETLNPKKNTLEIGMDEISSEVLVNVKQKDKKQVTNQKDKKKKKIKFKDLMSSIVKSDKRTDKEIFMDNQEKIRKSCGDGTGKTLTFSKLEKV